MGATHRPARGARMHDSQDEHPHARAGPGTLGRGADAMKLDEQALAELDALCAAATPGPWCWRVDEHFGASLESDTGEEILDDGSATGEYRQVIDPSSPDGVFIATARTAM